MLVKQEYCTAFPVICVRPVRQVMTDNNRHRMEWNGAMRIEPIELLSIHCFFLSPFNAHNCLIVFHSSNQFERWFTKNKVAKKYEPNQTECVIA